jgi:hypothetical protein
MSKRFICSTCTTIIGVAMKDAVFYPLSAAYATVYDFASRDPQIPLHQQLYIVDYNDDYGAVITGGILRARDDVVLHGYHTRYDKHEGFHGYMFFKNDFPKGHMLEEESTLVGTEYTLNGEALQATEATMLLRQLSGALEKELRFISNNRELATGVYVAGPPVYHINYVNGFASFCATHVGR